MESRSFHNPENLNFSAHELKCIRNELTLFENLSFELQSGKVLQIEGANGSGKTTLLRILCGLKLPDEGHVTWREKDIQEDRVSFYSQLAFIGHHNGVKDDLTCEENLAMYHSLGNTLPDIAIEDVLDQIGLVEMDDVPARTLSAGQKRRLALARLLMTSSPLWILDEPFTALDPVGRAMMESRFDEHCNNGGMIIYTTHHEVSLAQNRVTMLRIGP